MSASIIQPPASIASLPTELLLLILADLDLLSRYFLRTTHPRLRHATPPLTATELLEAENLVRCDGILACPACSRLRPRERFGLGKKTEYGNKLCMSCESRPFMYRRVCPIAQQPIYRFGRTEEEARWYEVAGKCWHCYPWTWRELHLFPGTCDDCEGLRKREEAVLRLRIIKGMIEGGSVLKDGPEGRFRNPRFHYR